MNRAEQIAADADERVNTWATIDGRDREEATQILAASQPAETVLAERPARRRRRAA